MKNLFILITILTFTLNICFCQLNYLNIDNRIENRLCEYDTSIFYSTFKYWDIYQTKNNKFNGLIDSIHSCIPVNKINNEERIDLTNVDLSKPLFLRLRKESIDTIFLDKNTIYKLSSFLRARANYFMENLNCDSMPCNKVYTVFKYPNESGNNYESKMQEVNATIVEGINTTYWTTEDCSVTSKLDKQYLDDIIFEINFNEEKINNSNSFRFFGFEVSHAPFYSTIEGDLIVEEPLIGGDEVYVGFFSIKDFSDINLLLHSKDGYPSQHNIDKKYLKLIPNPSEKKVINFYIEPYEQLFLQDYIIIAPELVSGSDSIFHELNIIQDGGEMCVFQVELLFDNTNFIYKKGDFNIDGSTACTLFSNNSQLIIDEKSMLHFGNIGHGILALADGTVFLKKNATLYFDGTFHLKSMIQTNSTIILEPESKIVFSENSKIININRQDEKLLIQGFPYQVDMTNLKQEYRDKIIFELPDSFNNTSLISYPNPTSGILYLPAKYNETHFTLLDYNGKIIQSGNVQNSTITLNENITGIYFLKIRNEVSKIIISK